VFEDFTDVVVIPIKRNARR